MMSLSYSLDFDYIYELQPVYNEGLISGERVRYDACSSNTLGKAIEFYGDGYEYIGCSKVTYHNGVRNEWDEMHYFFRRKPISEPAPEVSDTTKTSKEPNAGDQP
jgi:hypothetical protein